MSVLAMSLSSFLSITVYSIIWYLRNIEEDVFVTQRKYLHIISKLKLWSNSVFIGFIGLGVAFVFMPEILVVWGK